MAVPAYITDLNDIYIDAENFSVVGGGRVTDVETDDFIQGNNCWSHDPFSSGIEGGMLPVEYHPHKSLYHSYLLVRCIVRYYMIQAGLLIYLR